MRWLNVFVSLRVFYLEACFIGEEVFGKGNLINLIGASLVICRLLFYEFGLTGPLEMVCQYLNLQSKSEYSMIYW